MGPPPNPEDMIQLLQNPQFASTLDEALSNPQYIEQMIQSNPMLRGMGPQVRAILQNPEYRRMMLDPNVMRQMHQMQQNMGGGMFGGLGGMGGMGGGDAGGEGAFPAPGVTDQTPEGGPRTGAGEGQGQQQQQQQGQRPPMNPFAMFGGNPFASWAIPAGGGGGGSGQQGANPFAALFGAPPTAQGTDGAPATTTSTAPPTDASRDAPSTASNNPSQLENYTQPQNPTNQNQQQQQQQANPFALLQAMMGGGGGNPSNPPNNPSQQTPTAQTSLDIFNSPLFQMGLQDYMRQMGGNPEAQLTGFPPGMMGGGGGGGAAQAPPDNRPPEERYAEQLRQLNDMGFFEFERNVAALRRSGGNVQGAIEFLLS